MVMTGAQKRCICAQTWRCRTQVPAAKNRRSGAIVGPVDALLLGLDSDLA